MASLAMPARLAQVEDSLRKADEISTTHLMNIITGVKLGTITGLLRRILPLKEGKESDPAPRVGLHHRTEEEAALLGAGTVAAPSEREGTTMTLLTTLARDRRLPPAGANGDRAPAAQILGLQRKDPLPDQRLEPEQRKGTD